MESEWRFNVWRLGLSQGHIRLAARELEYVTREVYFCASEGPTNTESWEVVVPGQLPVRIAQRNFPGHFPHGFEDVLEPDN